MTPEFTINDWEITFFQVPAHDEDPSNEMVDWLNENVADWEGDESGIVLFVDPKNPDVSELAEPGDFVIRFRHKSVPGRSIYRSCGGNLGRALKEGPFAPARTDTLFPSDFDRLQTEVNSWALETFQESSALRIMIRGNKEMSELLSAISNGKDDEHIVEECADVLFFLCQVAARADRSLEEALRKKLEINKGRTWAKGKDGSFQHVETSYV